jgi:hypothetical protein
MSRLAFSLGVVAVVSGLSAFALAGETPRDYCRANSNDDTLRPITSQIAGDAGLALNLKMPEADIERTGFYRCMDRQVLVCVTGANLNCGKADTRRVMPAADRYCSTHLGAKFIPMVVTGHATIYSWSCEATRARAGAPMQSVDRRGFIRDLWAPLR